LREHCRHTRRRFGGEKYEYGSRKVEV